MEIKQGEIIMEQKIVESTKIFLTLYSYINHEIEFLREYYRTTYENLKKHRFTVEKKYEIGYQIDYLIDSIVNKEAWSINSLKLQEINETILFNNVKFKDVITNISIREKEKRIIFIIDDKYKSKDEFNPNIARYKYRDIQRYETIFARSIISDIIVTFESLLTKTFDLLIVTNPFPYLEGETIPLANYFLKDASKSFTEKIGKVVEKKLYDSLQTFEDILQAERCDIDKDILYAFKEIYYRRNIMVHNNSKVNKQYLNSVHTNFRKNLKLDTTLICDQIYLDNAFVIMYELFFFLYYGIFKNYSDNIEYLSLISNFAFNKLKEKDYEIAKVIYKKISTNNNIEFIDKMMYRINYLNALKQLKNTEDLTIELKNLDVSIATDNFKIAKYCLLNEHDKVYEFLQKTYPNSFAAKEIKEWPIFVNFRESEQYQKFCTEHVEDFLSEEITDEFNENQ